MHSGLGPNFQPFLTALDTLASCTMYLYEVALSALTIIKSKYLSALEKSLKMG